jgi:hypothetical protein
MRNTEVTERTEEPDTEYYEDLGAIVQEICVTSKDGANLKQSMTR